MLDRSIVDTRSGHGAPPLRTKPLVANLALAVASACAFLLVWWAGELAVRALDPRYLDRFGLDDIGYLHVYSESYGWIPRRSFRLKLGDGPVTTINAAGYRGPEVPLARTPGKKR